MHGPGGELPGLASPVRAAASPAQRRHVTVVDEPSPPLHRTHDVFAKRGDPALCAGDTLPPLDRANFRSAEVISQSTGLSDEIVAKSLTPEREPKTASDLLGYVNEPKGQRKAEILTVEAMTHRQRLPVVQSSPDLARMRAVCQDLQRDVETLEAALEGARGGLSVTSAGEFANACAQMIGVQRARKRFLALLRTRRETPEEKKLPWWKERANADEEKRLRTRPGKSVSSVTTPGGPPKGLHETGLVSAGAGRVNYTTLLREQERAHGVLVTNDRSYRRMLRKYEGIQALLKRRLSAICRGEDLGALPADLCVLATPRGSADMTEFWDPLPAPCQQTPAPCQQMPSSKQPLPPLHATPQAPTAVQQNSSLPLSDFGLLRPRICPPPAGCIPQRPIPGPVVRQPVPLDDWQVPRPVHSRLPDGGRRHFVAAPLPGLSGGGASP
eukprot:TRINITY_DN13967_c0_g1_i7.p1 TRINITY_DN13967_c0_g1~~TRINITY_DN13967_c0_g1_i7.p1  ORF type:complete len:462 (+),score=170.07 TRINITY_DN13967_c0_g1_i7:63-1388(+)